MCDAEKSRAAFEKFRDQHHYPKYPFDSSYWEFWEAAINYERTRLASVENEDNIG